MAKLLGLLFMVACCQLVHAEDPGGVKPSFGGELPL